MAKEVKRGKEITHKKVSTHSHMPYCTSNLGDPGVLGPGLYFPSSSSFALTDCRYATAAPADLSPTPYSGQ